jgi:glycosyltransferase involved in cell wall biosynthesis
VKSLVIVPAYNEETNIFNVVTRIKSCLDDVDVVVINDGSTDRTYAEAVRAKAEVINLPFNLGIGGAVQTGYLYALHNNYDIAVQIDGDGQHNPEDLKALINMLTAKNADIVIGSRFKDKGTYKSPTMRALGIKYFSALVSYLCGKNFYDTTSGYRVINKKAIKLFSEYYPQDYPEVEVILYGCRNGLKIEEVPVEMSKRQAGKSSITMLKGAYYIIKVTLSLLLIPRRKEAIM